ncbi:MAG: class I SAM-dependent methyltransferase [Actinobacteria bacterium]|nr:class I SAM-dependent methyltransferase [Actinomycetota bacterium]
MEPNQQVFDEDVSVFTDMALMPAERITLRRLAPRINEIEMLDLGVGTGRTSWTFAPLVKRYVGLDYSPRMAEAARKRLENEPNVEVLLGDARDLTSIEGDFDFILFSFNAIDAASPEGRLEILDQVHAKLKPRGLFQFSTHNLGTLPFDTRRPLSPRFGNMRAYRLYALGAGIRYAQRIRKINRSLDLTAARQRGWVVIPSMSHNFRIQDYYIDPQFQVEQLHEHGFDLVAMLDQNGRKVTLPHSSRDPWFDCLCTPTVT